MATIVLSTLGSMLGPLGQVVGTLAGNAIDNALFAPEPREGARLKELTVTGSSYGTPIARQYGKMRVPGTIVWSTDLEEHRDKQSNGKGAPKTVTYSYTVSFAVALSSGPIDNIGRIWADGNLLRGAAGDLKSAGTLRVYKGHGHQPRDPLMEAALGSQCPAFRGCAYAVFEDLDLTDFGNRIPALTFEVLAGDASRLVETMLEDSEVSADETTRFAQLGGFSHEAGSLRDVARLVDRLHPVAPVVNDTGMKLGAASANAAAPITLPQAAAWDDGDFGKQGGVTSARNSARSKAFASLRYYDPAREYQPGLQHAENSEAGTTTFQFPGALSASDALGLAREANGRAAINRDRLLWRCCELDPRIQPGSVVIAPGRPGLWLVDGWEWRERGVELDLVRHRSGFGQGGAADAGSGWSPLDRGASTTQLRVFETPWDGSGTASQRSIFAAASAATGRWSGAALYAERDGGLIALGQGAGERAVSGVLASPLGSSIAMRLEPSASLRVQLLDDEAELYGSTLSGIAQGDNRLQVGNEVVQFRAAEPLGAGLWELTGLLRGRGGTEIEAGTGHASGTLVTLLDDRLVPLGANPLAQSESQFAAIGLWDTEPARASLENANASLRPPAPVHCRMERAADGSIRLSWRRRARGQWLWLDEVAQPLVEEVEHYKVGYGLISSPQATWLISAPELSLAADEVDALRAAQAGEAFWVQQFGSFAQSPASVLGTLA
ncbi:phage tail protein [Qipengyuania sp. 1NDH17]|uniref:Phage tail protein n=1 Tax=Qipengyuania polymorpha TaxID=2867234 RepID=A0ABS7IZA0_9SPHN|nr:phage tail protein [Qipengyuania polymorpha]MBX7458901.1 phage tail protein [Qipengyuania polymorpha]